MSTLVGTKKKDKEDVEEPFQTVREGVNSQSRDVVYRGEVGGLLVLILEPYGVKLSTVVN